jgi:hypothetical protein
MGVLWMCYGCITDTVRRYCGCIRGVLCMYYGCIAGGLYYGCIMGVLWMKYGVLWMYHAPIVQVKTLHSVKLFA